MNLLFEPDSDHWLPFSLTHSLTDLIVVSKACEDANLKRVEVVFVADIYIMMKCLSVCVVLTKNDHFLLGISCNHL